MDERKQLYNTIRQGYNEFKRKITLEIQQKNITKKNDASIYLVDSGYLKEILNLNNYYKKNNVLFFSEIKPNLKNNLSKNVNGFKIIEKKLLLLLYKDYQLAHDELIEYNYFYYNFSRIYKEITNSESFNYIAGNRKLIVRFNNKTSLLILNPIDSIINDKNYVVGIIINETEEIADNTDELYKNIILSDLSLNNIKLKSDLIINDFDENYNNYQDIKKILKTINNYKRKSYIKNNRFLFFAYLYYYEKLLMQKEKEKAFKDNNEYYIINNNWLNKYKQTNNYDKICDKLKKYDEKDKDNSLDYYNIRNYKYMILKFLYDINNIEFLDRLQININELMQVDDNYNNSYIIHGCLYKMIFKIENIKEGIPHIKEIKVKEYYIYIINKDNLSIIHIGFLNPNLTFNTKYIIEYDSKARSYEEMKTLFDMPIDDYLKKRKCNMIPKNESKLQLYDVIPKENEEIVSKIGEMKVFRENENIEEIIKKENLELINSEKKEENQILKGEVNENSKIKLEKDKKINELSQKITDIQKDIKIKENKINDLIIENKLLVKERNKNKEELNNLKNKSQKDYNDINEKYKKIVEKYEELEEEKKNTQINYDQIKKEKNDLIINSKELEQSLKKINQDKKQLEIKNSNIQKELDEKNLLIENYKNQLLNLQNILDESQSQLKEIENKYNEKVKEFNILKNKSQNKDIKSKEIENILNKKEKDIFNIKNENITIKEELKNKNNELSNLKNKLNQSSLDIEEMQNKIKNLNNKIKEKDDEILRINETNKNLKIDNEKNNNLLKTYKDELDQAKKEISENKENLKIFQKTENDNNYLKIQLIQLNLNISELSKKVVEKNNENEKLKNDLLTKDIKIEQDNKILNKINSDNALEKQNFVKLNKKLIEDEEQLKKNKNLINNYESKLKEIKSNYQELKEKFEKSNKENEAKIKDIIANYENVLKNKENFHENVISENKKNNLIINELNKSNEQLKKKNNELNNVIQLKNNEINNIKKNLEENKVNKINEKEFQNIFKLNNELTEKNKELEKKEKENINKLNEYQNKEMKYLNKLNEYANKEKEYINKINEYITKEKEFNEMRNKINDEKLLLENGQNTINNEIKELEQKKYQINNEIYNLTLKLSELEQKVKEKKDEYEKLISDINKKNDNKDIIANEYKIPPNIGLNNVGATCFMNSTLQCLSHTKKLTNYFLNPKNKERIIKNNIALKDPNALQLSPLYLELITKLWAKDGSKNYSPYNFMNGIQSMNPLFQKGQAGDAKDFIIYILEQLHSELKKNMNKEKVELEPLNQYDRNNAMQHFFSEFQEELSIISDLFFGFNETTNICLDCKNEYSSKGQAFPICYNYGIFNCIIFPLEEVRIMKNKFMQIYNIQDNRGLNAMNNNRVSLIECFIYNQKTDKFTGDNQNYCNICRKLADSDYTSKIYISPNILILILNRGKGNKFDVKLDFAEIIDISDFVILKEKPKITYNLFGVVTHLGESGPYAHFIASCKSPIDNAWYRFNDGLVYPIKDFQKEVHDYGNPYLLFYQKNDF